MSLFFMLPNASTLGVVTVSGEIITKAGSNPVAGVRFNTDGTIDKLTDVDGGTPVYAQIDSATDFIIPNVAVSKRTFHVQATLNAESGGGNKTGTLLSWLEISTAREWKIERPSGDGSGISAWDLDIEISDDGGSTTLDTALFELTASIV